MKVALVHDYLNEFGGAERVLEELCEVYPNAPIYTSFYREGSQAYERFKKRKIITSWAQRVPFFASFLHSPFRFLAPLIWNSFDFSSYDAVITSASWYVTKGVVKRQKANDNRKTVEICYCHTPPRYLYGYATAKRKKNPFATFYLLIVNHFMRVYDFEAAQRVDFFIANSKEVQARIKKFYRKDSTVIYPPVNVKKIEIRSSKFEKQGEYFLVVSRLAAAKNVDIAVKACSELRLPLKVVGEGSEMKNLKKLSDNNFVEFLGEVSDIELANLYRNSKALIFPSSQEDFGIVPVEAMAAGKPVITLNEGGPKETIIDGKTGLLVDDLSVSAFVLAIKKFNDFDKKNYWDAKFIKKHAMQFDKERFRKEIKAFVEAKLKNK